MKWPQYFGRYNPTGKIYYKSPVYINKKGLFLFVNQKGAWSAHDKVNELGLLRGTDNGKDGNCVASVTGWEIWDIHFWRSANITVSCIQVNREIANMPSTQSVSPLQSHLSNRMSIIEEEGLPHSPGNSHSLPHQGEAVSSFPIQAVNIGQPQRNDIAGPIDVWPYIIGGKNATGPHEFPWYTRLFISGSCTRSSVCGGSLISKRLVATAFHCVGRGSTLCNPNGDPEYFSVVAVFGENIIRSSTDPNLRKKIKIKRAYAPRYGGFDYLKQHGMEREYGHDFAMLLLQEPVREEWSRTGILL